MNAGRELRLPVPKPSVDQHPVGFADEVGRWYTAVTSQEARRALGQFFTPVPVAEFMAQRVTLSGDTIRVLDPGSGAGVLACALAEQLAACRTRPTRIDILAFEASDTLADALEYVLEHLREWLKSRYGTMVDYKVRRADFVLEQGRAVSHSRDLFRDPSQPFDVAIANPPYFKLAKSDPRSSAGAHVVHGQPNIYALFLAAAASMLREGGGSWYV